MSSSSPHRVLIVGAGLTGALTAALLRRKFKQQIYITIWEKSRGAGGRMATNRSNTDARAMVDIGAQYISATPQFAKSHASFYEELLSNSVLVPFDGVIEGEVKKSDGIQHFVSPKGFSSVVKFFLQEADANVRYNTHCWELNLHCVSDSRDDIMATDVSSDCWQVKDLKDACSVYHSVIITIPVPQLLNLQGSIQFILENKRPVLEKIKYSSRYALALFFDSGVTIDVPWTAKYITGNPCVRFIALDNKRRGDDAEDVGPTMLVHSSVPFGLKYLETTLPEVEEVILGHLKEVMSNLPEPSSTKCHRWRYSQVSNPAEKTYGCISLCSSPLLIAAGDGFVQSNFDGCVESALSVVEMFSKSWKS